MAWMYLLRCANGAYYTGSTALDVEARVWQHNAGIGANFTRKHRPVELVYCEWWERIDDAFTREKQVQGWSRAKKETLIRGEWDRLPGLSHAHGPLGEKRRISVTANSPGTLPTARPAVSTRSSRAFGASPPAAR